MKWHSLALKTPMMFIEGGFDEADRGERRFKGCLSSRELRCWMSPDRLSVEVVNKYLTMKSMMQI